MISGAISETINLYEAGKNNDFTVVSVPTVGLLENLGIRIGTKIVLENRYAFGGPVLLRVENTYSVAVGKDIAKQIEVQETK